MLAPEIWNFGTPIYSVTSKELQTLEDVTKNIENQYFNHFVSIVFPNTLKVPTNLVDFLLEDSAYYKISKVPAFEFFQSEFVNLFVEKGKLTATSIATYSNRNDRLAITPAGKIILSLSQESYSEIGIDGKSIKDNNSSTSYSIVYNSTSESVSVSKNIKKIWQTLSKNKQLYFDVILIWEPHDENICPSSIALYFSKRGLDVKTCNVQWKQRHEYNVVVPIYNTETDSKDLIEWLGAFSLQCNLNTNSYISTMKSCDNSEPFGQVLHLSFIGLFTISRIQKFIYEINKCLSDFSSSNWIALTVQGFKDRIITHKTSDFCQNGDQNFTVISMLGSPFLLFCFKERFGKNSL